MIAEPGPNGRILRYCSGSSDLRQSLHSHPAQSLQTTSLVVPQSPCPLAPVVPQPPRSGCSPITRTSRSTAGGHEVSSVSGPDLSTAFLTALVVWLAALMTPGPDFAATVQASVGGSRRSGLAVGAGVTVGMAAWAIASLFGLHAVLLAFEGLGTAVRLAGAAYLAYIGGRLLWAAWQGEASHALPPTPRSATGAFRHGLLTNLANPKALALFGSLFAVLVPPDAPSWFSISFLAAVLITTAAWYALVAITMSTDAVGRGYRRIERGMNAVTGAIFVAIGARLATEP